MPGPSACRPAQLRRVALAVRQGFDSGGSFDVAGKYDLAKRSGEFNFNAVDEPLFKQLAELTQAGFENFQKTDWPALEQKLTKKK